MPVGVLVEGCHSSFRAQQMQLVSQDGVRKVTLVKFQIEVRNRSDVPWPFLG